MEIPNVLPIVSSKYFVPDDTESAIFSCVSCTVASTNNVVTIFSGVDDKVVFSILISTGLVCEIIEEGIKSRVTSKIKVLLILLFEVSVLETTET